MNAFIYIDAENHFLRSTSAAEKLIGKGAAAAIAQVQYSHSHLTGGFPKDIAGNIFAWRPELQLYWDCKLLSPGGSALSEINIKIERAVYACSCAGDEDKVHEMQVELRSYGFEPVVIRERKDLRSRRDRTREEEGLIDKPKGCDISLATRMVSDAAANLYKYCFLFTSDADFLPAVEAVQRLGKIVWVFGYKSMLQKRSPYLFVPDRFVDLDDRLNFVYKNSRHQIMEKMNSGEKTL